MGKGYSLKCRKCGYSFSASLGVGFLFVQNHQNILNDAKKGTFGKEIKQFLAEHPDGMLGSETVILQCMKCGNLKTGPDLSMYLPKEKHAPVSSDDGSAELQKESISNVRPWELKHEKLYGRYDYRCRKCGGRMRQIPEDEMRKIVNRMDESLELPDFPCPKCGKALYFAGGFMWD